MHLISKGNGGFRAKMKRDRSWLASWFLNLPSPEGLSSVTDSFFDGYRIDLDQKVSSALS